MELKPLPKHLKYVYLGKDETPLLDLTVLAMKISVGIYTIV